MLIKYLILSSVLIPGTLILIFRTFFQVSNSDPNKFFHLGMANHYAKLGFIKTLPQASQTEWARSFIDPTPWYHFLNGILYQYSGELGIIQIHRVLSCFLVLTLLVLAYRLTRSYLAIFILCFTLLSPDFAITLSNLGPQNIEFLFLSLGMYFLIQRRYLWAQLNFVILGFFTPFLPLTLFLLASTCIQYHLTNKKYSAQSLILLSLFSTPLLCHPEFPNQLNQIFMEHYRYFHPRISGLSSETPLRTDQFIRFFWPFLLLGTLSFFKIPKANLNLKCPQFLLLSSTLLLWFFGGIYRPVIPYALISTLFVFFLSLKNPILWRQKYIFPIILLLGSISIFDFYSNVKPPSFSFVDSQQALSKIPRAMVGKLIFNCNWEDGNYIFYLRPDLRTLDLYSPILLKYKNPQLFDRRSNPTSEALSSVGADYVYCDNKEVFNRLVKDEKFELVYPTDKSSWVSRSPYLYARKNLNSDDIILSRAH